MTTEVDVRNVSEAREAAFEQYVLAHRTRLLRMAYLLCGDGHTAEDLVQTSLAKLYLAWERVESAEAMNAYTRRILVNESNSWWRRAWRRRERPTDELPEQAIEQTLPDPDDRLWRAVRELPPRQRSVIVLRYYEQLSEAETAAALGIAVGTVKSQASRALASLRTHSSVLREEES